MGGCHKKIPPKFKFNPVTMATNMLLLAKYRFVNHLQPDFAYNNCCFISVTFAFG